MNLGRTFYFSECVEIFLTFETFSMIPVINSNICARYCMQKCWRNFITGRQ